jgi:hypothetical protein
MTRDDDEPTEEERREAEALARALEGRRDGSSAAAPDDALETAGLLGYARTGDALDSGRSAAILDKVVGGARPTRLRPSMRARAFAMLGLAAVASATLLLVARSRDLSPRSAATLLPVPPRDLLDAQVAAAGTPGQSLSALSARTAAYRDTVYATLKERYRR